MSCPFRPRTTAWNGALGASSVSGGALVTKRTSSGSPSKRTMRSGLKPSRPRYADAPARASLTSSTSARLSCWRSARRCPASQARRPDAQRGGGQEDDHREDGHGEDDLEEGEAPAVAWTRRASPPDSERGQLEAAALSPLDLHVHPRQPDERGLRSIGLDGKERRVERHSSGPAVRALDPFDCAFGEWAGLEVGELRAREERGIGVIAGGPREPEPSAEELEDGHDRGREDDERHQDLEEREALVPRAARR